MRRKKRKLRVSFDLKLNLTRISCVKFDDPSNLMTLRPTGRFFIGREQMKKNTGILIGSLLAVILCVGLWFAFVRNKQFNDSNIIDPGEELIISGTLEIEKDLYPGTYDLEYFDTEDAQIYL